MIKNLVLLQFICVRQRGAVHYVRCRAHEGRCCRHILRMCQRQVWRVRVGWQPCLHHETADS